MTVIFFNWICIKYYLTSFRLIEERGIIGKRIMIIWLDQVQDVTCRFGILGRVFGFGDIIIESAGTYGQIVFGFLPYPEKRADVSINERLHKWVGSKYKRFKFDYFDSPKAAFEKECNIYHDFGGPDGIMDNEVHPKRPVGASWQCPRCNVFKSQW